MNTHALDSNSGRLLTASQAARLLGVHVSTIRRWISQGTLPAYRLGEKSVRVRYADVSGLMTPLSAEREMGRQMSAAEQYGIRPLTEREQEQALAALERARKHQAKLSAKYGIGPDSWELLEESRDDRTQQLLDGREE